MDGTRWGATEAFATARKNCHRLLPGLLTAVAGWMPSERQCGLLEVLTTRRARPGLVYLSVRRPGASGTQAGQGTTQIPVPGRPVSRWQPGTPSNLFRTAGFPLHWW